MVGSGPQGLGPSGTSRAEADVASLHQAELGFLVMAFKEDNRGSKGWGQRVEEWGSLVMA